MAAKKAGTLAFLLVVKTAVEMVSTMGEMTAAGLVDGKVATRAAPKAEDSAVEKDGSMVYLSVDSMVGNLAATMVDELVVMSDL